MKETWSFNLVSILDKKEQKIHQVLMDNQKEVLLRWVCDTREKRIKEALIKLGWTPPKD